MRLTEKLDALMAARGLTRGKLAAQTGIPYNTIVGLYTKGYSRAKLSTLKGLADYFGITLDLLCDDEAELSGERLQPEGAEVLEKYLSLSPKGRRVADTVIEGILEMEAPEQPELKAVEYIREYVTPAAAGIASPALGEDYVLIPRESDVPSAADFAVRISGYSMEPVIADGSRVYVSRTTELGDGDVGIFFVDGDMKCKQYCEDNYGNIYLFSINRARKDADMTIMASSGITVFCFGKVLLPHRPALPQHGR